jgi:hypothetical protein
LLLATASTAAHGSKHDTRTHETRNAKAT